MFQAISKRIINQVNVLNAAKRTVPKRPLKERVFLWFKGQLKGFCEETPLHGYNHMVSDFLHFLEKIFWRFIVFAASVTALILLYISWSYNVATPTITVIESTNYPAYNVPFPSITICNVNKISMRKALQIAERMKKHENMTAADLAKKFKLLLHFKGSKVASNTHYTELHEILSLNNMAVDDLLISLAPTCDEILERCIWKGSVSKCDTLFQPINSSEGMCCSFNNHAFKKNNYNPKVLSGVPKLPRKIASCGYLTGLSMLLNPDLHDYHSTEVGTAGFKLMIHSCHDYTDQDAVVKFIPTNVEAFVMMSGIETKYITRDGHKLPEKERDCIKRDERQMNTMAQYTYVNCMAECRAEAMYEACGCIPYFLPNNGSMPKCKMNKIQCVKKAKHLYGGSVPPVNATTNSTASSYDDRDKKEVFLKCDCLPDCEIDFYPSETTLGPFDRSASINNLVFFKDINLVNHTIAHVFFTDLIATRYRQDMFQNWLGVFAAFGGVLGLFLGFSAVAAFEFAYFFTIRPLFDKLKKKQAEKTKAGTAIKISTITPATGRFTK